MVLVLTGSTRASWELTGSQSEVNPNPDHLSYNEWGRLYDNSQVVLTSGGVRYLSAHNYSIVNISGGSVSEALYAWESSTINIYSGHVYNLTSYKSTTVNISGGSVGQYLYAWESSTVNISGGAISLVGAFDNSIFTFSGQNFSCGSGLTIDGSHVLGTGMLFGEWLDGTPFQAHIQYHDSTATIVAVPEPVTILLFGLGAVMLRRKANI